ncbi:hypothetical protein [Pelagibius sp.]|uniref:hypothetical protein n=1 Tax=Pelagibius sp. TaxID=1931238 RepID=UPI003B503575
MNNLALLDPSDDDGQFVSLSDRGTSNASTSEHVVVPVQITLPSIRGFATDRSDSEFGESWQNLLFLVSTATQTSSDSEVFDKEFFERLCKAYVEDLYGESELITAQLEKETEFEVTANQEVSGSTTRLRLIELRRIAGLTWDELAKLLNVERRSLHNWSAGKPISKKNEKSVADTLATLRYLDRGMVHSNRDLLFSSTPDGRTVFELIATDQFDEARRIGGKGKGRANYPKTSVDQEWIEAYGPLRLSDRLAEPINEDEQQLGSADKPASKPVRQRRVPVKRR